MLLPVQLFQQKTRQVLKDKSGKPIYGKSKDGTPFKQYRYKLTGKRRKARQKTLIMGVKGYKQASVGYTTKTARESTKKIVMLPVGSSKRTKPIYLTGETIKDTIKNLKPNITVKQIKVIAIFSDHHWASNIPSLRAIKTTR